MKPRRMLLLITVVLIVASLWIAWADDDAAFQPTTAGAADRGDATPTATATAATTTGRRNQVEPSAEAAQGLTVKVLSRATSAPVAGVPVDLRLHDDVWRSTESLSVVTDAGGCSRFPDAVGNAVIAVESAKRTCKLLQQPATIVMRIGARSEVRGHVCDDDGESVPGATIFTAHGMAGPGAVAATTDAAGSFVLSSVSEESYVWADKAGYIASNRARVLEMVSCEAVAPLVLARGGATLAVRAVDGQGNGVAGVTVTVTKQTGLVRGWFGWEATGSQQQSTTGLDGRCHFRGLYPGEWGVLWQSTAGAWLRVVDAKPGGQALEQNVDQASNRLQGSVVDRATMRNVPGAHVTAHLFDRQFSAVTDAEGRFSILAPNPDGHLSASSMEIVVQNAAGLFGCYRGKASDRDVTVAVEPSVIDVSVMTTGQALGEIRLRPKSEHGRSVPTGEPGEFRLTISEVPSLFEVWSDGVPMALEELSVTRSDAGRAFLVDCDRVVQPRGRVTLNGEPVQAALGFYSKRRDSSAYFRTSPQGSILDSGRIPTGTYRVSVTVPRTRQQVWLDRVVEVEGPEVGLLEFRAIEFGQLVVHLPKHMRWKGITARLQTATGDRRTRVEGQRELVWFLPPGTVRIHLVGPQGTKIGQRVAHLEAGSTCLARFE